MFLRAASRSKFEAIFGSDMRPLFSILGLLLCLIATRAGELPVIKDSEAVRYVGNMSRCAVWSAPSQAAHSGPYLSISDESTPTRRSRGSLKPVQKWRLTGG